MRIPLALQPARISWPAFSPVLAPLMERRGFAIWSLVAGSAHLALAAVGYSLFACPFLTITGIECPGCGLTTASLQALHGDWRSCLETHVFAPLFLALLLLIGTVHCLPLRVRGLIVERVASYERRTGALVFVGVALCLYWCARGA